MSVAGVLLAAGGGRRMGTPKALLRDERGVPFLDRAVGTLLDGGCAEVTVVLGAAADEARALLDRDGWLDDEAVTVVEASDWDTGMGASLRAGLEGMTHRPAVDVALVSLVDVPDVGPDVVARLCGVAAGPSTLARATYHGRPGHPVLLGRDHWTGVVQAATGDKGARDYLATHEVDAVECGDLATGRDVDHPSDLRGDDEPPP
ncbi:MAG TPA: nucleotidyltransferase family protein [Nocardioides sp.]|nr:nucleotidyltransferase family protein [Nocardioides sp.]